MASFRRSGLDAFPHPRPPSGSATRPLASTSTHRFRRPSSPASYTRRPLPPGPGPLDKKGEKLILRPINGTTSETFKPRKPSERSSNVKPLRALHSLDHQYTRRPESESSTFNHDSGYLHTRRTKSFDDINFNQNNDPAKKRLGDSPKKLQPLNYRSSNFGHLSQNLARGGSPHHSTSLSPSSHIRVETSYVSSFSLPSSSPRLSPRSPTSTKTSRESFGGTSTLRRTPSLLGNERSTSLGDSTGSFSRSRSSLVSVHTSDFSSAAKPGEKGLENLGNTCYQNTIYQCLSHTVKLREFLVLNTCNDIINPNSLANGDMMKEFGRLVRDMWDTTNKKRVLKPTAVRRVVSRNLTFFANYRQHDAQEFLRAFVDALHDDVNRVHVKPRYDTDISDHLSDENKFVESWRRQTSREKSVLSDLFVGVQRSTLRCMDCGNQRCTFDAFWDLSLPIPGHSGDLNRQIRLEECLKLYCAKEVLDGDNKVTCNHCRKRTCQQKWLQIEKFPQILVLHLKRFVEASNTYVKVDNIQKNLSIVQFPLAKLSLECTTDKEIPPTYDCYAVANHCGNRGGGHYTAFCRHSTQNKWIMYSDERVSSISSLTSVVSANAYILFYERTNPTSHL